jgi:hypothetical protein
LERASPGSPRSAAAQHFSPGRIRPWHPPQLCDRYLTAEEDFTRRRLLDTRIAMYLRTQKLLSFKAFMVTAATLALGAAVILTVIGGIVG